MAAHRAKNKSNAQEQARRARARGFKASVFKKKKCWGVSVTKK